MILSGRTFTGGKFNCLVKDCSNNFRKGFSSKGNLQSHLETVHKLELKKKRMAKKVFNEKCEAIISS